MKKHVQSFTFGFLVLLLAWLPAHAVTVPDSAFDRFMLSTTGANQQTVTFGGNGTPVLANASANLALDADGSLYSTRSATVPNPAGNPLALTAKAKVGAAVVGALALKALPFVTYLGAGVALYDFFKGLGYDTAKSSDGSLTVTKNDPSICSVAPCYRYQVTSAAGVFSGSSQLAACSAMVASPPASNVYVNPRLNAGMCSWDRLRNGTWSYGLSAGIDQISVAPSVVVGVPSSAQELADAIAAQSGWPSGSKVAEAVQQAYDLVREPIKTELPTVTGPATTQGKPEVSTETNADGSTKTTTKQTVYNHNYSGPLVTTTATTTTNVQSCTGSGACSTASTVTTTQPSPVTEPPTTPETCGLPGKPVCAVKVDETGTPDKISDTEFDNKADKLKVNKDAALDRMKGTGDTGGLFSGWNVFFSAPAFVPCAPIVLPSFQGQSMGSINACPVVDGVREIMAYIWAAAGLFLSLGFIRQTVQGG